MYSGTPPILPPKPLGSGDVSRIGTPSLSQSQSASQSPRPQPTPPSEAAHAHAGDLHTVSAGSGAGAQARLAQTQQIPDPGEQWLPRFLEDKSKQDLAALLSDPSVLAALTHAPRTIHPSLVASHEGLAAALADNVDLARHLTELEARVLHQRAATQAQLLTAHALERQWRAKQTVMDMALAPFAPASLYQRLAQGVAEQEGVCAALEESFLEATAADGAHGVATEREATDWVRRYREAKKLYYLRQERKERWDEGRVGGWR